MTRRWALAVAIYRDRRILAIFFMGFSSGLPFALITSTLGVWLGEAKVSLTTIGFFALAGIAYNVKFLWAPVMDRAPFPWLTAMLGRRRGWAIATQTALLGAIFAMGQTDPAADPALTALFAVLVAFASASQDIVIDAFRVDLLESHEQGAGAAAAQFGWRVGALVSGAGALYAAAYGGWGFAYSVMAVCVVIGMVAVLFTPEPDGRARIATGPGFAAWIKSAVIDPFADFVTRRDWALILLFVVLFKMGDALTGVMASPFYVAMGFTKIEIANVSKIFGTAATLTGVFLGGVLVFRMGALRALILCGILQMLANLMFAAQALVGHDVGFLILTIGIDNVSTGMGSAAFVAYLSSLCNIAFTATQYALLSSLAVIPRTFLASSGGWIADELGWVKFFMIAALAATPGLALLLLLVRRGTGAAAQPARSP